jgi:glycosyltransferase involved in cell wall biosynthesis
MKILHVIPSLNKGGAERICLDICLELKNQGHDVKLVTLHDTNSYTFLTKELDYSTIKTQLQLSLYKPNKVDVKQLQEVIHSFQPDVIHSHLFEAEINLAFCQISSNTKRIIHFHDNMKQMQKWNWKNLFTLDKEKIANYYERHLVLKNLFKNSVAIGISKDTINYIQQNVSKLKTHYLLNAIDLKRFKYTEQPSSSNNLVMIGSLVQKKGQELAIKTVAELMKRGVDVQLFLLGDGQQRKELEMMSETLKVADNVLFEGLVDFPENYLINAKIYIHTASYEPFGLVLIEAMACGLPVVCTDGKGNRDIIIEGENGFLVWERNAQLLADKVQFLLENEETRFKMSKKAKEFAQQFGMKTYIEKLIAIYKY